ncbi:MAG: ABC transporter substrate-binding protein [Prevotella bivia]|jgi:hypothetical protein|uniref:ABC-type nitrate/sulfonate/bicarbonate transport system, periplasmic component n=3 Tax=Prevotella bivia TaxID=28125 RepID=I4Z710_9BACT|nr:hypothetical protein [Prevotella bivia]EIM32002.1 ABC-type nitrate/sulfonate/bicarbonate transport system, periplasmic component [Prevotella bivia DSM 20514]KGF22440.1 hypothetical protein HMPREF1651_04990 [Prevotella bivia DNF00188]KGF37629.1 hypothetical protein HMPREF2136_05840 [Prevotella bivia DNF00650]KGF45402.1 hypothetical protein HMPREF0647_02445 [Prevotella bivia DNF00320]KXO18262.1 hypothetical protein HMPREF3202_00234 [Prevotella bivia]
MKRVSYLLFLTILMLVSCGKSAEQQASEQQAKKKAELAKYQAAFKVAVMPTLDCLPAYLLKDSLLYDTAKVDIRLKEYNAQMDCDTAMIRHRVQAAFSDLVRTERLKRRKKVLMHYLTSTNASWKLIADRQSKVMKLAQLSDKILAMTRFSATDLFTDKVLKKAEPKYKVFRAQINDVFVRLKMLANHEIDAYWFQEPQATVAMQGDNILLYDTSESGISLGVLAIMDNEDRSSQETAFAEAYNKAIELINERGVKYYAALIKKYMGLTDAQVNALPTIKYTKTERPRQVDLLKAMDYVAKIRQ